jgi:hypothetical protein
LYAQGQIVLRTSHGFTFNGLDMEEYQTVSASKIGLNLENCRSGVVLNLRVFNSTSVADTVAIYATDNNEAISVLGGQLVHVNYALYVFGGNRGNRGWIVQPPAVTQSDATTPARIFMPQQNSLAATASGGHIVFHTIDRSGTGTVEDSFIAGIEFPSVQGVATIGNPDLKDGWVVFDSLDGKLKLRTGGTWIVVGAQIP